MTATTLRTPLPSNPPSPNAVGDRAVAGERRWLLGLSLLHAALAGVAFLVLGAAFDFPDILRLPAAEVLTKFNENPAAIRAAYYAFSWSSLLLIPLAVLLRRALRAGGRDEGSLAVAAALGLAAGLTQLLGFIRWTIFVPFLADAYADPATTPATRDALAVAYEFANRYLGMTIGEHLGWLFQGIWVVVLGVVLLRRQGALRWLGWVGLVIASTLLVGSLEQFQLGAEETLAILTSLGSTAFPFWLIGVAVVLMRRAGRE